MNKYYSLEKLFHMNFDIEDEYNNRIHSPSTFVTSLKINPFIKGVRKPEEHPLFIYNSAELILILEKIYTNSAEIIAKQSILPEAAQEKFFNLLLINELQSTNEIESIHSSKKEISEALSKKDSDSPNLRRFTGMATLYSYLDKKVQILEPNDFRKIYDVLVGEEVSKEDVLDGEVFRKGSVSVYAGNDIIHHGLATEDDINNGLADLIRFMNYDNLPKLYKIFIGHYYFEYIHPFYDDNGRVGRYLLAKSLTSVVDIFTAITLSYSINRNKNKYYKSFEKTSHPLNKGDMTLFVKENLELLVSGQEHILSFLTENIEKMFIARNYINDNIADDKLKNILFLLLQSHLFSAKDALITHDEVSNILEISKRTLNKYLEENEDKITVIKKNPKIYTLSEEFLAEIFE